MSWLQILSILIYCFGTLTSDILRRIINKTKHLATKIFQKFYYIQLMSLVLNMDASFNQWMAINGYFEQIYFAFPSDQFK